MDQENTKARAALPTSTDLEPDTSQTTGDTEIWTIEYLIDRLHMHLVSVTESVKADSSVLNVHKYLAQARKLMPLIPVAKPSPEFVIRLDDMPPRIKVRIANSTKEDKHYILRQAVGRVFEELDSEYYHFSIARQLRVTLK